MRILVVAATAPEIEGLIGTVGRSSEHHEVLVTGVGMVATAVHVTRALSRAHYDIALNLGVCGSFDPALPPGTVVHITSDRIADLGAEDGDRFLAIDELGLLRDDERVELVNAAPPFNAMLKSLPTARGITVNTVHGNQRSIDAVVRRCHPQVESMEGAAFMYACLMAGVPFAQVRAVSNVVERRNREAWKLHEAIDNLSYAALRILRQV